MRHTRRLPETTKRRETNGANSETRSRTCPSEAYCHGERRSTALKDARVEDSSMLTRLQGLTEFPEISGALAEMLTLGAAASHPAQKPVRMGHPGKGLLADAELGNDALVTLGIVFLQIVQQATPLADQHEKAAARAVVFLVRLEVLRQLANPFAEERDLVFRAAGIAGMRPVLVDEGFLVLSG